MRLGTTLVVGCALTVAACGSEFPPFAELPLRDALLAQPAAVAALDDVAMGKLRERFVVAMATPGERAAATPSERAAATPAERGTEHALGSLPEDDAVARFFGEHDNTRFEAGADADPLVLMRRDGKHFVVAAAAARWQQERLSRGLVIDERGLQLDAKSSARVSLALSGPAGALLQAVAREVAAHDIVLTSQQPFAIAVDDPAARGEALGHPRLWVNAAWLVAMAVPLETAASVTRVNQQQSLEVAAVTSVEGCAASVRDQCAVCEQSGACGEPVTEDFATGVDECRAVPTEAALAVNMCMALAIQRTDVLQCVERNQPNCVTDARTQGRSRVFWTRFSATEFCRKVLDNCAANPDYVLRISGTSCSNSCNRSCGCNPSVSCNPSCSSPSCSNCSSTSLRNCRLCAAAEPNTLEVPFLWSAFWALAPWLYLRRRAAKVH